MSLLDLFITFIKINFLTTSGPASIGLTRQLVVPTFVSADKFNQILALSSGIPGSDAIQMAYQVGYVYKGFFGALIATLGALLPCIFLVTIFSFGLKFIDQEILAKFFKGINPALAITLLFTAINLYNPLQLDLGPTIIFCLAGSLFFLGIPIPVVLIMSGIFGLLLF